MKLFSFLFRSRPTPQPVVMKDPYRAVEVVPGRTACEEAKAIRGVRHLARISPPIVPLRNCTQSDQCSCRFEHHSDRRGAQRRRNWDIIETRMGRDLLVQERGADRIRKSRGRRKTD
ncbi:MAG: hypothetical protein RLZZ200_2305 [Pseudomonadota bacterium]|jgi:hypothetical protein